MDVAFAKNSNDGFVLNLITYFFFILSLLLIFVAHNKFVIFTYLVPAPSVRGKLSDDRTSSILCIILSLCHGVWQGIDP